VNISKTKEDIPKKENAIILYSENVSNKQQLSFTS